MLLLVPLAILATLVLIGMSRRSLEGTSQLVVAIASGVLCAAALGWALLVPWDGIGGTCGPLVKDPGVGQYAFSGQYECSDFLSGHLLGAPKGRTLVSALAVSGLAVVALVVRRTIRRQEGATARGESELVES